MSGLPANRRLARRTPGVTIAGWRGTRSAIGAPAFETTIRSPAPGGERGGEHGPSGGRRGGEHRAVRRPRGQRAGAAVTRLHGRMPNYP